MEQQQNDTKNKNTNTNTNSKSNTNTNNYLCRQSSTRWTPTSEQIKLLKELYYINGVRSPSAEQIQSICSRLRRYGKIEGKNVFYWFQNHKARERQKKKLTSNTTTTIATQLHTTNHNNVSIKNNDGSNLKQDLQDFTFHGFSYSSSSISCGGQLMGSYNHGAVTMENNFRDCSISGDLNGENHQHVNQWSTTIGTNYHPYAHTSYFNFLIDHKISTINEDPYIEEDHYGLDIESPEIETLPLFPMQNEDHDHNFYTINYASNGACYSDTYQWSSYDDSGGSTSLELSLNS